MSKDRRLEQARESVDTVVFLLENGSLAQAIENLRFAVTQILAVLADEPR